MVVANTEGVDPPLLSEVKQALVEYMKKTLIGLVGLCFLSYSGEADSIPTEKP
jgi:hypothetical protein